MATDGRDIVVVAASAGGLLPMRAMMRRLPADLPAAILVVLHVPTSGGSSLPGILDRSGPLKAAAAVDGEPILHGRVYVAPPDRHLLVIHDEVRLSRGPRQNGVRPAADPLFRSAALHAGPRTVAVVLSGTLDDGALGSATVERRGGVVVVQDPAEADYDSMPRSAIATTKSPVITATASLGDKVISLLGEPAAMPPPGAQQPDAELIAEIAGLLTGALATNTHSRSYSGLTCPECSGPLYVAHEEKATTFDCLVGHRWSARSLFEEQSSAVERALWLAVRSLEERSKLTARLARQAGERGHALSAQQFFGAAEEARQSADAIREVAHGMTTEVAPEPDPA